MFPEFYNIMGLPYLFSLLNSENTTTLRNTMIDQCSNAIYRVSGSGISTKQQKKTWLINLYFANDPMGSIYLATLRNPALVASYHPDSNRDPGMLYGANGAAVPIAIGMENYFIKIKTIFGQIMLDQRENVMTKCSSGAIHCVDRLISKLVARDLNLDNQITSNEYVIETPEEVTYLFSSYQLERGAKRYELANHLGNVLTVISDKKTAICTGNTFNYFTAERISATDYSPFGTPLAGRTWQASEYRFGFNSMEKDNEINGTGNAYDFGARIYDGRLGRWLSVDPLFEEFVSEGPYAGIGNRPIKFYDPDGKKIICEDKLTQQQVLKAINSNALGVFAFNEKNELYNVSTQGDKSKFSQLFQVMLICAIESDNIVIIRKAEKAYNSDKGTYDNVSDYGEGLTLMTTIGKTNETDENSLVSKVYYTGKSTTVKDEDFNDMKLTPEDIIVHELIGHGIPFITNSITGDAVDNENIVRDETGKKRRHETERHNERDSKKEAK